MSEVDKRMRRGGTPLVPSAARSWDRVREAEAGGWIMAIVGEVCVQPSVLARCGVGAGGSFLPTGEEKQTHLSALERKGVNLI